MDTTEVRRARLRRLIEERAFVRASDAAIISRRGLPKERGWLFDIRSILMRVDVMNDLGALFWERFAEETPVQIGCMETAGIPLMATLVAHAEKFGAEECSGFFIRKSRKKDGLMKMIEGEVENDKKIILVDDLVNSGKSLVRQVEVVESLGHTVGAIWTIMRFRDNDYYEYFARKGIAMNALFTLDDFKETLGTENLKRKEPPPPHASYKVLWKFASENPSYFHVVPKSDPVIDETRLYVGSDSGAFWALNQHDGSVAWSHKIGFHPKGKGIFSSPALADGIVYFGAYDGNVYALDAATGKKKWIFFGADWIGSSPALAPELGLLFIGLEFGLWRKRGGIAALDVKTGKKVWEHQMPCYTHSSPLYIAKHRQVIIGSNDGVAYLFDARAGKLLWRFETGMLTEEERNAGSSAYDIKESFAYDEKRDQIIFGNKQGYVFFLDRISGVERVRFKAEFGFYSTPVIYKDTVLISSLDKHLYCLRLDTGSVVWKWRAGARVFATPAVIEGSVYIGANTGRLTELSPSDGKERSFITFTERITNRALQNPKTKHLFVPTFANEIYCLKKYDSS